MTEAWVRWRKPSYTPPGEYLPVVDERWSKWHHITVRPYPPGEQRIRIVDGHVRVEFIADDRPGPAAGELRCRPFGFKIPAGAEYRDGRPPRADSCTPCIRHLDPGTRPFALAEPPR